MTLRSSSRLPAAAIRRRPGIWWPRGQGGGFVWLLGVQAGVWGWLWQAPCMLPPASVGRRQEVAKLSLTWILWRRCWRRAARRLPAPPACGVRWVSRGGGLWAPCPKIQPVPLLPPWQRQVVGEMLWGHRVGCFGDLPPWGSFAHWHPLVSRRLFQAGERQVLVVQVLLAWDLGMLQDLGVTFPP